ncbi:hypothetical protein VNI00_015539 [Paramarasmius palmivorus]|uniref:Uncharacterized protein n=1 Tax=Paramarasmius palmivorus TaxID=297713 RepID=A0AAW0BKU4_9AGAR
MATFGVSITFSSENVNHHLHLDIPLTVPAGVTTYTLRWLFFLMSCIVPAVKGQLFYNGIELQPDSNLDIVPGLLFEYRVEWDNKSAIANPRALAERTRSSDFGSVDYQQRASDFRKKLEKRDKYK